jgi:hypothetical protein
LHRNKKKEEKQRGESVNVLFSFVYPAIGGRLYILLVKCAYYIYALNETYSGLSSWEITAKLKEEEYKPNVDRGYIKPPII